MLLQGFQRVLFLKGPRFLIGGSGSSCTSRLTINVFLSFQGVNKQMQYISGRLSLGGLEDLIANLSHFLSYIKDPCHFARDYVGSCTVGTKIRTQSPGLNFSTLEDQLNKEL